MLHARRRPGAFAQRSMREALTPVSCWSESCLAQLPAEPDPAPTPRHGAVPAVLIISLLIWQKCNEFNFHSVLLHWDTEGAADGGGRGPPKPVINYYLIRRRGLCPSDVKGFVSPPCPPPGFPSIEQNPAGLSLGAKD